MFSLPVNRQRHIGGPFFLFATASRRRGPGIFCDCSGVSGKKASKKTVTIRHLDFLQKNESDKKTYGQYP